MRGKGKNKKKTSKKKEKIVVSESIFWLIAGICMLIGFCLVGFSTYYWVLNVLKIHGYDESEGRLIMLENCEAKDDIMFCNGVYQYYVDGWLYTTSPDFVRDKDSFKQKETVYYNPENPSESVIPVSNNNSLLLFLGVFLISVPIIVSFRGNKKSKN